MQPFMRPEVEKIVSYKITNPLHNGWMPQHQVVNDDLFVVIDKYDTDFFKFCTGEHIRWGQRRDPQCHYFEFYESILQLRNSESQKAFAKAIQDIRDAADERADVPRKRQKIRRAKMSDVGIAGEVVDVVLEFAGRQMPSKMLFGCRGTPLYVKADPSALGFIQHAMHANFIANVPRPMRQQVEAEDEDEHAGEEADNNGDEQVTGSPSIASSSASTP
jgi:hypothetical protein